MQGDQARLQGRRDGQSVARATTARAQIVLPSQKTLETVIKFRGAAPAGTGTGSRLNWHPEDDRDFEGRRL